LTQLLDITNKKNGIRNFTLRSCGLFISLQRVCVCVEFDFCGGRPIVSIRMADTFSIDVQRQGGRRDA